MKRFMSATIIVFAASGCIPDATDAEIQEMCEKLTELRGEVQLVTVSEAITVVEKEYAQKKAKLEKRRDASLNAAEAAHQEELGEADSPEAKAKLAKKHEERKKEIDERFEQQVAELTPGLKEAKKEASADASRKQGEWQEHVDKCIDESKQQGVKQPVAQCRIKAKSTDTYWNRCR
jgi:hypothetical protein